MQQKRLMQPRFSFPFQIVVTLAFAAGCVGSPTSNLSDVRHAWCSAIAQGAMANPCKPGALNNCSKLRYSAPQIIKPKASLPLAPLPCRPIGEFWQRTAEALAEVVCETGWSFYGTSAQGIADSSVLSLAPASEASFNACAWVAAAILAQVQDAGTLVTADQPAASKTAAACMAFTTAARDQSCQVVLHELGHPDAAADLPPHYKLIHWLVW